MHILMKSSFDILEKYFTYELLIFSWNQLKLNKSFLSNLNKNFIALPIGKSWFKRVSFLISHNQYRYNNDMLSSSFLKQDNFNYLTRSTIKAFIIQNAFVILLKPYFKNVNVLKNFTLTECLRILKIIL